MQPQKKEKIIYDSWGLIVINRSVLEYKKIKTQKNKAKFELKNLSKKGLGFFN